MAPKKALSNFFEAHPPTPDDYVKDDNGNYIELENGLRQKTDDYLARQKAWEDEKKKAEQELKAQREADRVADPPRFYLSSESTIAAGTKDIINQLFEEWEDKQRTAGSRTIVTVMLSCKKGFFDDSDEKPSSGWGHWWDIVNKYTEDNIKEKPREIPNLDTAAQKMRERMLKAMKTFPLMVKAQQNNKYYGKQIDATYAELKSRVNDYGHSMALRARGSSYINKVIADPTEKYTVCPDDYEMIPKIRMPAAPPKDLASQLLDSLKTDETAEDNPYYDALKWALKGFYRGGGESADLEVYYGNNGHLTVDTDGWQVYRTIDSGTIKQQVEKLKAEDELKQEEGRGEEMNEDLAEPTSGAAEAEDHEFV